MSLTDERREYRYAQLSRASLLAAPEDQFAGWMQQALDSTLPDPTAMVLASVDAGGQPWQRTVLLKGQDERGLVFYSNYESNKAQQMAVNSQVSVLFPWLVMDRQVIVTGTVRRLPNAESQVYFHSRPRDSQLAAWTSAQSQPVDSREVLEENFTAMQQRFGDDEIPMPEFWGGFAIEPRVWEFWQGGENRLHDRFRYTRDGAEGWDINRLSP
ncbi:MAG: pyridoxamine 5'-phosphate oxidase [Candidatus Pseudothioglobus sp.]|jgi:pyridoxamine 5'-phosphate oxidase